MTFFIKADKNETMYGWNGGIASPDSLLANMRLLLSQGGEEPVGQMVNELRAESLEGFLVEADLRPWIGWQEVVIGKQ